MPRKKPTTLQWVLMFITVPVSTTAILAYGWQGIATLTGRSGISGVVYVYGQLSKYQFITYSITIAFLESILLAFLLSFLYKRNGKPLILGLWIWLVLAIIVTVCEVWLKYRE